MCGAAERGRLLAAFACEPARPRLLLAKCAAGLLVVAALAFAGDFAPAAREQATVDVVPGMA